MQETSRPSGGDVLVPEDVIRTVATNLYRARVNSLPKKSQKALAEESKVSINTIAKIEELRDPAVAITEGFQFGTVLAIGAALNLSTEQLFISRVKRDGKVSHLALIESRAGPPLHADTPIQLPTVSGVSSSRDHSSKHSRSDA